MERYCLQSTRDSRSNQAVCWKSKSGQRKRRSMYQNYLWLKFIRTLILSLYSFKFLILSVVVFNMKTFYEHELRKKKSQNNHWRQSLKNWKLYLSLHFLIFWRKIPSVHHKMVSHSVIIEFIILMRVTINFLTIFPNNKKVLVLRTFFGPPIIGNIFVFPALSRF